MYKNILVPIDGSPLSASAADQALQLAKAVGASVTFIHVIEPYHTFSIDPDQIAEPSHDYERRVRDRAQRYLAEAKAKAEAAGVASDGLAVEHAYPYEAIIGAAGTTGADLIAMASHGRRGVAAVVLGSETVKVLTHSTVPVLVYRQNA
ncbi:universal stress protein [Pseudochelatococcus sp. B33]